MSEQYNKQTSPEWHVVGLMIQCNPEKIDEIKTALLAIENTEVSAMEREKGRLVVAMESYDQHVLLDNIEKARDVEGVIVVSLVYHEQDK
ncbi:periplasmic nitrate reductase chaperone NapD [Cricetibacter osteomyelitidis]|uniref:Chaperone NapD n=1 Tax=Cricetibacter osteomyelitidis TaxID=1521931 RepID=A0A4R2TCP2_9PAST|nr:chaperone NapD [Cricetibacter osteomyelitidis]TCP94868.1 periplasmic nitrate reductase chaperone NapD [Cricetibacter osteomyelitidis]